MKPRLTRGAALALLLTLALGAGGSWAAAGPVSLTWWATDGGGGVGRSTHYTLHSTIGQPDAGVGGSASYTLVGGYWGAEIAAASTPTPGTPTPTGPTPSPGGLSPRLFLPVVVGPP